MPDRRFVYRLVVDTWPTADGRPFTEQTHEFWEQIVDEHAHGLGPSWLPADLSPYSGGSMDPAKYTHWVGYEDEMDTGWAGSTIIHVPVAPTRRFFTAATVQAMCKQLREWGCAVHVERAQLSDWEQINA